MSEFRLNTDLTIDLLRIGQSREPVLIIDDVLEDPERLVEAAATSPNWQDLPPGGYPGRRAPLPRAYVQAILRRCDPVIKDRLLGQDRALARFDCSFSLVTQPPQALSPLQRLPHIDIARPDRIALLHYLCSGDFGGTAFFRQDATGLEQIGPKEKASYLAQRARDVEALGQTPAFPSDGTPGYGQIGAVEARFNRVVLYRSMTLHSGVIADPERLSKDPRQGRLTANFFVDYERRPSSKH